MFGCYINRPLVKLIVVSLLALFLTACAGLPLPRVKPTDALEPDKGLVIIRIVSNEDFIYSKIVSSWWNLKISEAKEEGRSFTLNRAHLATKSSTQIFSAQIPQGTYKLSQLIFAAGNLTMWLPLDKLGTFKVIPGHITNLGTIICQPISGKEPFSIEQIAVTKLSNIYQPRDIKHYQLIYANIDAELHEMIANNYPVINKITAGKKMIVWNDESLLENTFIVPKGAQNNIQYKSAALSFAKTNSAGFNNSRQIATGEIFAGSKLGQVLVKERDGKWTQLDTGFMHEITAVLPIDRNTIYAGGEEGVLLLTNDGGRSWKRIETPLKTSIYFFEQINGRFFIGEILYDRFRVYETMNIHSNNWKSSIDVSRKIMGFIEFQSKEFTSYISNSKFYIFVPGSVIYVLDLSTNNWNMINTPFDYINIYSLNNGLLYAVSLFKAHISDDFGNSWISTKSLYTTFSAHRLHGPVFKDNLNAFVLLLNPISHNVILKKTQDSGKRWEEVNDFNDLKLPLPTKLFYDYINNKLYFAVDGMIYIASDDFKNWTRVR